MWGGGSLSEGPIRKSLHESKSRVSDKERFKEQEGQIRHVKTSVTFKDSRRGAVAVKGFASDNTISAFSCNYVVWPNVWVHSKPRLSALKSL